MKYFNPIFFLFFILLNFFLINNLRAQGIPQNISTANIDDLSDSQIRQIIQQAQASGLSDAQLIQQAQGRGMSPDQIQTLQRRITQIRNSDRNINSATDTGQARSRTLNYQPDTANNPGGKGVGSKIFGADLFRNKNLTFEPNLKLATPLNYVLGPDDQLNVNIYGNSLVNWKLTVSPEGNINIPGVGLLDVSGKTIEQATTAIKGKLASNNYSIGKGTSIQVTLGNIRSIKVIMVGEVVKPGTYTLPSLATVFNALYSAGGPNDNGTFRQIEIIRNNEIIRRLDIYDFLVKGDQKNNIRLQDQDIIRVPTYRIRVEMDGEVKRPALFEVLPGENLQDVIRFSGGFTDQAYTALIKVSQISNQQRRLSDILESDFKNYIPLRGDKYTVERILERYENRVTINGAVFRPGEYELQNGLTLLQLIQKAAGLKEDAFTSSASIIRLKADNTTEELSFNLRDILNKTASDIVLQREDVISVSSIFDLRDQYRVTIKGEIRHPGEFAYADSMTVNDLIVSAGGFAEGASAKRIEVSRRIFDSDPTIKNSKVAQVYSINVDAKLKSGEDRFTLKPFDIVSIYNLPGFEKQKTVKVEGEVVYPGFYTIQKKDEKISDIVLRAGGLTASADVQGGSLRRDNISILDADKTRIDTNILNNERSQRIKHLQHIYKDSTGVDTQAFRNNYVGINLKEILDKPGANGDLILENGDILRIPKQQQIVKVNGEVLYPSAIVYTSGKSFRSYVLNAGGYAPDGLKRAAYVVYPNGTVKGTGKFLFFNIHPAVKPGSEIYVPKKPVSKGTTIQEILGFTTGLVSLVVLLVTVRKL